MSEKYAQKEHEVAKPMHMQSLEDSLNMLPFMNQVTKFMPSEKIENYWDKYEVAAGIFKRDKFLNHAFKTLQERRADRLRLYNFSLVGTEREYMRNILMSSESDTSSGEEDQDSKNIRINKLYKERRRHNKFVKDYYKDHGNLRYMYYGAGILSTIDRYPERRVTKAITIPQLSTRGRSGRLSGTAGHTRRTQKSKRVRRRDNSRVQTTDLVDDLIDWEDQLGKLKDESDIDFTIADTKPGDRSRKKLSTVKNPEILKARRRRHWQLLVKKELGKMQRAKSSTHREITLQRKRLATLCSKHWRHVAMQSQKNMKETVWRCKRLSREMQNYWRRYDRAERETRRRMEREAEEQRKMDVELMEAKRQRRKLNFLITQTELYAHFMQKKMSDEGDGGADHILRQLDEDRDLRLAITDNYDSEAIKAQASKNAREALKADRARTRQFDAAAGVDVGHETERRSGDYNQPSIFQGTLKGYQLKGMNWLASLYDQGISGILADEMGLGKTVQCIAFLCHVAERLGVWGPFLVVSPASTLHNWQQEMQRFVPDFKVVPYWGSPAERRILRQFWVRKDLHTPHATFHVVITSYQIVISDLKYLNRVSWQYMILDEAQAIKSSASMRWKLLLGFSCRNRLLLSGTPIQNSMAELWALLHFIMPTLFDSHEEFNEWFSKDIESHAENKSTIDEKHLSRLHMILKPFMLRRIKKDVENELSDKIEILVHCPLTVRQKLLYIALKKKIKIEELLHFSVSAESADKMFTSNLMNLVMQFRKVCNHPELFERRDIKSPFVMQVDDYHVPKVVAEECINSVIPSKRHLLYNKFSIIIPEYIHKSVSEKGDNENYVSGFFGFTRLMDLSPTELFRVMLFGWMYATMHIDQCLEKYEKLRHRKMWWNDTTKENAFIPPQYYNKDDLLICPDGDVLRQRKWDSLLWQDLLFANSVWSDCAPFYYHKDHSHYAMPETVEHRAMRLRHFREKQNYDDELHLLSDLEFKDGGVLSVPEMQEFPQSGRRPVVYPDMPTPVPGFINAFQPKVCALSRQPFAASRSFAYYLIRHQHSECQEGSKMLTRLIASSRPSFGWAHIQVPDKNQLVSDAGKLTVLDSLLKRLKQRGHRVLIYSQMTKMIDLLEEYMWYRKHKYMRLDGSSKISARRDMVADFQARTDIFAFLLSTRAGGLGINLTAADTVIFYDSDWNPTVDQQAMDRAHRLGQTKQVTVYRLICKGTIEERIMQRAREKSEIQRMVISGGNFKPDTLKPKEVVSLLLDDEDIELKYRQKSEEKKLLEERERKRKMGILPQSVPSLVEVKRSRDSPSEPPSPLEVDDKGELIVDILSQTSESVSYSPSLRSSSSIARGSRVSRRGRPRGSRHASSRRSDDKVPEHAVAVTAGAASLESGVSLGAMDPTGAGTASRGRRGPGRPRLRSSALRGPFRRLSQHREPLLVPLAPPP